MSKDEQPSQLRTTRNGFKLINGTLIINEMIRITPMEVRQMGNWMRKWRREDSNWLEEHT